jgi:Zn finger protein HypA/HybF involved in hydrogenase expression
MSDTFQMKPGAERRREQHRCACGARFEVGHHGDPKLTASQVDVKCPACGKSHTISVPKGTEKNLTVELAPGLEPETGGGG